MKKQDHDPKQLSSKQKKIENEARKSPSKESIKSKLIIEFILKLEDDY